jgi:hypothetical protein
MLFEVILTTPAGRSRGTGGTPAAAMRVAMAAATDAMVLGREALARELFAVAERDIKRLGVRGRRSIVTTPSGRHAVEIRREAEESVIAYDRRPIVESSRVAPVYHTSNVVIDSVAAMR